MKFEKAFEALKEKSVTVSVLAYPDYEKQFVACTDASNKTIGAVLSQLDENGREHLVHFARRVFPEAEINYSTVASEALGVIFALKKLRHYLLSKKFK